MNKIGLFFGSTTGNTEMAAQKIQDILGEDSVHIQDIDGTEVADMNAYPCLVLGIPTWDIGELQEDWDSWMENFDNPDLNVSGKKFAVFGMGDQEGYPDTFGDAIGVIHKKMVELGAVPTIDSWEIESYNFEESVGLKDGAFLGMMLDEDSQSEHTDERIAKWCELAKKELLN